ncbi:MAG: hypothetical protein KDD70_14435 [Bdellovibrionales bacterium]|nr:hypothetical protein [Bdellovibrionales bacterium]
MKADSVNNKLRLSEALKSQSTQNSQNQAEVAKAPVKIAQIGTDAVRSSVDARLASPERTTGSGRSIAEITSLVQSGRYFDETSVNAVAEAVGKELLV